MADGRRRAGGRMAGRHPFLRLILTGEELIPTDAGLGDPSRRPTRHPAAVVSAAPPARSSGR
ncbi:hypothetical protein ACIPLC_29165 [Kitasatospora sp. NPDC086801]|uniref:hypothetical protein n=1 Tax=Kitasatospora sp. NPDC086801 TaxID=3364066 RepID=UPI00382A5CF0